MIIAVSSLNASVRAFTGLGAVRFRGPSGLDLKRDDNETIMKVNGETLEFFFPI
jgi:hypothetical protein